MNEEQTKLALEIIRRLADYAGDTEDTLSPEVLELGGLANGLLAELEQ